MGYIRMVASFGLNVAFFHYYFHAF